MNRYIILIILMLGLCPVLDAGNPIGGILFDKTDDWIKLNIANEQRLDMFSLDQRTYCFWVFWNQAEFTDIQQVLDKQDSNNNPFEGWGIYFDDIVAGEANLVAYIRGASDAGHRILNYTLVNFEDYFNQWVHCTIVYSKNNNSGLRFFVNALPVPVAFGISGTVGSDPVNPLPVLIGARRGAVNGDPTSWWFGGILDDIRIYDVVLSTQQIKNVMKNTEDGMANHLIFNMSMDSPENQVDHSGQECNVSSTVGTTATYGTWKN